MHTAIAKAHPAGDYYAECTCGWWSLVIGPQYLAEGWARNHMANDVHILELLDQAITRKEV
jgi:hypothetical protein